MSLSDTPRANRIHIGIFGKRNSGKSSLINALTGQDTALVSEIAGTTADPVYKAMEIYGIGPCVFIDTAGFDDEGSLGEMRVKKTIEAIDKTDIALLVFGKDKPDRELEWIAMLKEAKVPIVAIINKADIIPDTNILFGEIEKICGKKPLIVSAKEKTGIDAIREAIIRLLPSDYEASSITEGIVNEGDTVLLVMPQDIQAPKGRLILPQVQTTRDLLDKKCIVISATTDKLDQALAALTSPPDVIITDSQVFKTVYEKKPASSKLTSFSVLYANYKGDLDYYIKSAEVLGTLSNHSKVLIAEACTHVPLTEDIGKEKIPRMLRETAGANITINHVSGPDFPKDLSQYDLIIQCGACMFNRKHVLSRIEKAKKQDVPMTNYGIVMAYMNHILDKISY